MNRSRRNYINLKKLIINLFFLLLISKSIFSNEITFEIEGNQFTDYDVILSLLNEIPKNVDKEYSNDILKALNDSNLFSDVNVKFLENKYIIYVKEHPNINKLYFNGNDRIKDEELKNIASLTNITNFNPTAINSFVKEIEKLYFSFGYNNVDISFKENFYEDSNTVDLYFEINEGTITKIDKIIILGNNDILDQEILEIITSKTKSLRNIFANNNYKPSKIYKDEFIITNYYQSNGYINVDVKTNIEYLETNRVNVYFNIIEGDIYSLKSIQFTDNLNILDKNTLEKIDFEISKLLDTQEIFSADRIQDLRNKVSSIIIDSGIEFFEIKISDQVKETDVEIFLQIIPIKPKYTNQINIIGNTRTFDYVIRRELEIVEGDAVYESQIQNIRKKLNSLKLFESVNIKKEIIDDNNINLLIEVEEKQTGTFNAGVSVGTLDGFSVVTGLRESNFYGTGRSLDVLVNTSEDRSQFKLITTDRLSYENDADISYSINYKQQDFASSSSYKLDTFSSGIGIGYKINKNLSHNIDLEYVLKDYKITNTSTVSESILNSSGGNASFLLKNNLRYSTLNPGFVSKKGRLFNFNNTIETPTSSSNGYVRNLITFKQYFSKNKNIFSVQTKLGNIFSLNNNDILTDDKFALGGRWLRGFDNYGAGPRNSRTSYVGGNNIAVTKFDYSYEITRNSDFPFYLNFFNDYGLIWENKTKPTQSDNNLRSSVGFGLRYYSAIGPIGFSWGFPVLDESYDINRMFIFSIGNID